jgi:hypothetical protein
MLGSRLRAAFRLRDPFRDPVLQVVRRHNKQCRYHRKRRFPKEPKLADGGKDISPCRQCAVKLCLNTTSRVDGRRQAAYKGRPPRFHGDLIPKDRQRANVYWRLHGLGYGWLQEVNHMLVVEEVNTRNVGFLRSKTRKLAFELLTTHRKLSLVLFALSTSLKRCCQAKLPIVGPSISCP